MSWLVLCSFAFFCVYVQIAIAHQQYLSDFTSAFLYHLQASFQLLYVFNLSASLKSVKKTMVCQHPLRVDVYFAQQFWPDFDVDRFCATICDCAGSTVDAAGLLKAINCDLM